MALDHFKLVNVVVMFILMPLTLSGCSETPTASVPPASTLNVPAVVEDEVDSGDENGPAVSKPLDEPPVK